MSDPSPVDLSPVEPSPVEPSPVDLSPVDLSHIDTWLFDLDNTLYPAESGFMSEVVDRMTDFVEKVTGLPREDAFKLQKTYLAEHGLTLKGMMLNHGVDPASLCQPSSRAALNEGLPRCFSGPPTSSTLIQVPLRKSAPR